MPDISEPKSRGPSSAGAGSVSGEPRAAKVAVAALVLGMIAFVPVIGPPFGLIAMLCGAIALIKETVHKKLAMLGLALGFVGNLVSVGTLLLLSMWFSSYVEEAMVKEARAEIARLEGVVDTYRALSDSQELPESLDDLTRPPDGSAPLLDEIPKDPWGQEYVYHVTGEGYELYSRGPDQIDGTWDDIGREWE